MFDTIDIAAILSVAFIGSFGHCIGMCGGFILAYSSAKIEPTQSKISQFFLHVIYSLGRISSYVVMGVAFGFIGGEISYSRTINGYIYFLIGIFMVLMGLSLMGKIRFLTSIESSLAFNPKIKQIFSFLIKSKTKYSFYFLGVLNGFLPCGLVYFFLVSAIASGSWLKGGIIMLIFGLSTLPALSLFGTLTGFLQSTSLREVMIKIASIIIILYGIYLSYLGFMASIST